MAKLPTPYDYLDHRAFLRDWIEAKKVASPRYSYRVFSRRAGTSVSLLHHVIEGKRNLTAATTEAFATALSLRAGEARFFGLLVAFDAATTADERNAVWAEISTTRRFREARDIERLGFDYLSSWVYPAVRELATLEGFRADPVWIARQLEPAVGIAEASRALALLVELGLLVERDGTLVPAEASVATAPEVTSLAVRNYHHGMIGRAQEAIERFPGHERHLLAVTVGVPVSLLPRIKDEANGMMQRLMDLCDSATDAREQVVQINLQVFPLSRPVAADQEP
ncbi:MAG: TIGR02147 family protein [Alphaproteobacteria bacterium]|nr:TIGR02147 family protein [Alphaproteobacteria bacterium]